VKPTWLQRPSTLLSIGPPASAYSQTCGNYQNFCFPPIPGDYPLSNGQLGLFKTQLTVNVRSEVIPLGVILKVVVLSIHSWKFVDTACFVQEVIAYECTHVWASEKRVIFQINQSQGILHSDVISIANYHLRLEGIFFSHIFALRRDGPTVYQETKFYIANSRHHYDASLIFRPNPTYLLNWPNSNSLAIWTRVRRAFTVATSLQLKVRNYASLHLLNNDNNGSKMSFAQGEWYIHVVIDNWTLILVKFWLETLLAHRVYVITANSDVWFHLITLS
jgi:hypothetical protein